MEVNKKKRLETHEGELGRYWARVAGIVAIIRILALLCAYLATLLYLEESDLLPGVCEKAVTLLKTAVIVSLLWLFPKGGIGKIMNALSRGP